MSANHTLITAAEALADLGAFDAIIDVRSPAEFAEDHVPGAVNWPVLDNEERRIVGTLHKQSAFEGRKLGAALVARNIARHLEQHTQTLERDWRPLVYCWRGGQRSGAMAWFLGQVGWRARQLQGGYKAYRAEVRGALEQLPLAFDFKVLCGRTGSGKTRLLHALAAEGAQVLDLEGLAAHRGSVLGGLPDAPQPSQKRFDSLLWERLRELDPARPVFVESESRKIGRLAVPEALLTRMRGEGHCLWLDLAEDGRVELLLQDYAHFSQDVEGFCALLDGLVALRGREKVAAWQAQARAGQWAEVFRALMLEHYDPGYERSLRGHYARLDQAEPLRLAGPDAASLQALARRMLG